MVLGRNIVRVAEPCASSMASLVLLTREYRYAELERYLALKKALLDDFEASEGCLRCCYCGRDDLVRDMEEGRVRQPANLATIDHIVPVSKGGGKFDIDNCAIACYRCNQRKADKMPLKHKW